MPINKFTNLGPVFILNLFPSIYFYYLLLLTFWDPGSCNRFLLLLSLNMQIQRVINLYLRHQIQIWDASTVVTSTAFFQVLQHFAVKIFSDRIFFLSSTIVSLTIFFNYIVGALYKILPYVTKIDAQMAASMRKEVIFHKSTFGKVMRYHFIICKNAAMALKIDINVSHS